MSSTKTPTSSLSAFDLLFKRVWYRTLATICRVCSGGVSLETSMAPPSPAARLPLEVVQIIMNYLTYDKRTLRACTLTCYSWYIAAAPQLHYTLVITMDSWNKKHRWPNPIHRMHTLGLLPLVKKLCVNRRAYYPNIKFPSTMFNRRVLREFSTLTNVQELEIGYLDIPRLMPKIQLYFGHFSLTVRSLILREPRGSCRQIIYFIGLFQHLQNLKLEYEWAEDHREPVDDLALVPPFIPPLRGGLTLRNFTRVRLLKGMIELFGGIRFDIMLLYDVEGMRLLLDAGAKTLQSVTLYPTDPRAMSSIQDFDLSCNKSLRSLAVPVSSIDGALDGGDPAAASRFLKHVLSTITPSTFPDLMVLFWEDDLNPWADKTKEASKYHRRFEVLREVYKARSFRLVFDTIVLGRLGEERLRMLGEAVAEEKARGGFGPFFPEPLMMYEPQRL